MFLQWLLTKGDESVRSLKDSMVVGSVEESMPCVCVRYTYIFWEIRNGWHPLKLLATKGQSLGSLDSSAPIPVVACSGNYTR